MNSSQRKNFIWYFRKRLESLNYCDATFETTIEAEKKVLMDSVNNENIKSTDPEFNKAFSKLNNHVLPTFRNCMLLGACTLIEDVLLQIGTNTITNFENKANKAKKGNVCKSKKEEGLSKIRKYLQVLESKLDFAPIDNDLQLIDDIVKIRNAIAHAWGKIDSCNNPAALRNIISRRDWVKDPGDGYIYLEDEAYADAITPVLNLVEHILDSITVSDD